ncbi:MAG: GntR family transcriptional regulator [Victivallaceae bacterium]|jgi:DNA-binding GntR family transcriptional regulator
MNSSKIRHLSLSEEIYSRLMRLILDNKYPDGYRMREEKLCAELGVSRTPLREAMIRLDREGILERMPRYGCIIRHLPPSEIAELLECRKMLECLTLREYFSNIDLEAVRILKLRLEKAIKNGDDELRTEILNTDETLHALIVSACCNRFLAKQLKDLQMRCRPYRVLRCAEAGDIPSIISERRNIINSILAGQKEDAAKWMEAHFDVSLSYYKADDGGLPS